MQISASMVKELRERTGAGMMDCKKALQETGGDIEAAIENMRKSGLAKAAKKAGRITAEGNIVISQDPETGEAVILEVNSETDFVAKDENFHEFGETVARCILENHPGDIEALSDLKVTAGEEQTVEELRLQLLTRIGENIGIRRFEILKTDKGNLGKYLHGTRIGVLVDIENADDELARDIAMHIAGHQPPPVCVTYDQIPPDLLEKEKEIFTAQARESGKPDDIIEKRVNGQLTKFKKQITLLGQDFVKDPDIDIEKLLANAGASVNRFVRYEVGEGIEKRSNNFAEEVIAQARGE